MEMIVLFLMFLETTAPARDEDFDSPGYREMNAHTFYRHYGYFKSVRASGERDVEKRLGSQCDVW